MWERHKIKFNGIGYARIRKDVKGEIIEYEVEEVEEAEDIEIINN